MKDVSDINCPPGGTVEKEVDKEPEGLSANYSSDINLGVTTGKSFQPSQP